MTCADDGRSDRVVCVVEEPHNLLAVERTRDFKVTVFEHPKLVRADVDLTFPDYTKLPRKHIEDTRRVSAVEGTTPDAWDRVLAVNVRAHFLGCKVALPAMAPGGSIVLVSSIAGLKPGSGIPAYDASKAALFGLCRHVAREGEKKRVRANVVVPGLIDTPIGRWATQGRPSRASTAIPLGRQGTAWEVAYATIFLLSAEADYITGQQLVVDGGLSSLR